MTIQALIRSVEKRSVRDLLEESIHNTKKDLVQAQVEQQYAGFGVDGNKIGKYKSKPYAIKKFFQNPLAGYGFIDLHLTGDLHKGVFAEVRENSVVFGSMDEKYPSLAKRWPNAWGLNAAYRSEYSNTHLKAEFVKLFKQSL